MRKYHLQQDFRQAIRQLHKSAGFALTVVLTLAIGVGANLAVFRLLHSVLFAQLPIAQPAQLYSLRAVQSPFDAQWFFSYPAYRRLRQATGNAAPVIARSGPGSGVLQVGSGFSQEAHFELVSDNFFAVLGLSPAWGRFFQSGDDAASQSELPVVLRYGFAEQHFGHSVVGMKAVLNRTPIVVIGVAPERFFGVVQGTAPDLWLPLTAQSSGRFRTWFDSLGPGYQVDLSAPYQSQDSVFWLWLLARVPEAGKAAARNQWTSAIQPDLNLIQNATRNATERQRIKDARVQLVSAAGGEGSLSATYGKPLLLLMGMAGLVFLIGCINLANLQFARLALRQREIAVRIALGASRRKVLQLLLVEDSLPVAIGGCLAFATCGLLSSILLHWASGREQVMPIDLHFSLDDFLAGAALLLTALIALTLLPAWQVTRGNLGAAARSTMSNRSIVGVGRRRWPGALLAAQVSVSLLLLSMAILFARSLLNLGRLDAGLDREHVSPSVSTCKAAVSMGRTGPNSISESSSP